MFPLRPRFPFKKMRGFTLIEIVIVLFIVGVVLSLTLPNLPDISGTRLKSASRKLAATIKFIRSRAVVEKRFLIFAINIDNGKYSVKTPVKKGETFELQEYRADFSVTGTLPDGIRFEDIEVTGNGKVNFGEVTIKFSPGGFVDRSIIHLVDSRKETMTLLVHPAVGRVRVIDGYAK